MMSVFLHIISVLYSDNTVVCAECVANRMWLISSGSGWFVLNVKRYSTLVLKNTLTLVFISEEEKQFQLRISLFYLTSVGFTFLPTGLFW
jgi:hypothetical protein